MTGKKVAIYVRTSIVPAAPALQHQVAEARQLAERLGCARPCIVADAAHGWAVNGGAIDHRPGFAELRAACEQGEIDTIIVASPDRLSRSQSELAQIVAWADDQQVEIISLRERIS